MTAHLATTRSQTQGGTLGRLRGARSWLATAAVLALVVGCGGQAPLGENQGGI